MRPLSSFVAVLALAAPATAQVVRVSVSTAGTQADGASHAPSLSGDGRFVAFASAASNLVPEDTNGLADIFLRDRDTDADGIFDEPGAVATTRLSIGPGGVQSNGASTNPVMTPDGRYVCFVSTASTLVPGVPAGISQVYRLDRVTGGLLVMSSSNGGALAGNRDSLAPSISDDGEWVAFQSTASNWVSFDPPPPTSQIYLRFVPHSVLLRLSPNTVQPTNFVEPTVGPGGWVVVYRSVAAPPSLPIFHLEVFERAGSFQRRLDDSVSWASARLSASGLQVVGQTASDIRRQPVHLGPESATGLALPPGGSVASSPSARYHLSANGTVTDFDLAQSRPLAFDTDGAAFDRSDRWLAFASVTALGGTDGNGVSDIFVLDLPDVLDADNDAVDDGWETFFGATDPAADPDVDGATNAQEFAAGTHPRGTQTRFLAEGATGSFFHTVISLANPDPSNAATALLTFATGDGRHVSRRVTVPAGRSVAVRADAVPGVEETSMSTSIDSDRPLGVTRNVSWDYRRTFAPRGFGLTLETAAAAPSPAWFLAEGSTVLGFELFYLLQNPQPTATQATVRFLLPGGQTIARTYDLAPGSRTTVHVNEVPGLEETDVAGEITTTVPIVVERAMYRSAPDEPLRLGHASMGVPAAATEWFLAEGATGSFFDLYVLIANPGATAAAVDVRFARPDGSIVTRQYSVGAHSRFSIYVDDVAGLANTSVATTVTSTNAVPIVVERAMYWPGSFFDYYESHGSAGSTGTAQRWVVAGAENNTQLNTQSFVLIANTTNRAGTARLTFLYPEPLPTAAPIEVVLPANSRTTVPVPGGPTPSVSYFGVLVESVGASPVDLVVESAVYRTLAGGPLWGGGGNALATPLP
jgi:hypothetical protein